MYLYKVDISLCQQIKIKTMSNASTLRYETMYTTIKAAFNNGEGDVFFTKDGKYVAKSRHADLSYYFDNGYTFLTYDQIMAISKQQDEQKIEEPKRTIIDNLRDMSKNMVRSVSTSEQFYDEFPDAYGQSL